MKNFEYWEKEIKEIAASGSSIAVANDEPTHCRNISSCKICELAGSLNCARERINWFLRRTCRQTQDQ